MINQERGEHHVELSSTFPVEMQHGSHSNGFPLERSSETKTFMKWEKWNMIFAISCVTGLLVDPLFLYIPFIDDGNKCIGFDKNLVFVTTICRSLMDITSIVTSIVGHFQVARMKVESNSDNVRIVQDSVWRFWTLDFLKYTKAIFENLSQPHFIIDILSVLPIPQVLLAVNFRMGGHGNLYDRSVANFFLAAQYLPRLYRVFLVTRQVGDFITRQVGDFVGGAFSFFLYIFASHVLGAFWYFFSIQRETTCWRQACRSIAECTTTYYCDDTTSTNITLLTQLCPINPSNASTFDFGIFLDALKSGNTGRVRFAVKLYYSLWWGLRNLSNFGTNLQTSSYVWEIFFAMVISVVGLFILTIVIGKMQIGVQYADERRRTLIPKLRRSVKDLKVWMNRNGVPENLREEIMRKIIEKLEDRDANTENLTDLGNLFSILPSKTKSDLKRVLCMSTLTKVPRLEGKNRKVFEMMCDYLKPVVYTENSWVVKMDEQLDRMILITKGTMLIYPPNTSTDATPRAAGGADAGSSSIIRKPYLKTGDIYGDEELLIWASSPMHVTFANLPLSKENVKCHSKVEGFALTAYDLKKVISKLLVYWNPNSSDELEMVAQSGTVGGDHEESDQDSEQSDG